MKHAKLAKKLLTMLLCVAMLCSLLPTYALAAETGAGENVSAEAQTGETPADVPNEDGTAATPEETSDPAQEPDAGDTPEPGPAETEEIPDAAPVEGAEGGKTADAESTEAIAPMSVSDTDVAKIGDTGYATLEAAIAAAADGDTIELLADVTLSASVTITKNVTLQPAEGLSVTIHRGTLQAAMFKLSKATLTLSGSLTLDGAKSDGSLSYGSIVLCESGASLVMNEGVTLQNNQHNNYAYGGAVTLKSGNASFIMNGGTITNCGNASNSNANSATFAGGGAVRIFAAKNYNVQMVMNGGTISNCFAQLGGAVGMSPSAGGKASFTMNGGTITGCVAGTASGVASNRGSVVYMHNSTSNAATDCLFTMYGGTITGNTANQYGCLTSYYQSGNYSGCFQLLGGHIYGNLSGAASQRGNPGTGAAGTMHGMAKDGSSPFVIGGSAVIEDEIWNRSSNGYVVLRDDFTGSVSLHAVYGSAVGDLAAKSVAADGTPSAATAEIAGRVALTNPDYGPDGNYQYDEEGNIIRAFSLFVDPDVEDQYILGEYVAPAMKYTVTYTDGVDGEEIFADQSYTVEEGSETPAFEGSVPVRKGYTFDGWDPEPAATVTENVTYTARWAVCEHVWGEPVFDGEALTYTYTCTVCGETKITGVVAKIESTGEYYETLQSALDAAKAIMVDAEHETQTVTLLNDTTESVSLTWVKGLRLANNFNLTIDLAGHTVTGSGSSVMAFSTSGTGGAAYRMNITIADSSADKTGTVTGGTGKVSGSTTYGGAIHMTGKSGDSLTINGGNFVNNTATTGGAIYSSTVGLKVIVNGGTFTGNSAIGGSGGAIYAPSVTVNGGVITGNSVTGSATFTGRGGGICVWTTTAMLEVTGGQIYGNTAERYGDDIVFASTSTSATSSPSMKLLDASAMGCEGIYGWFVDGYNGAYNSEANKTERYSEDYIVKFDSYADFSGKDARGKAIALKAAQGVCYTVTYTDGVADEELFADQVYSVAEGLATPAFEGTPEREGYTFAGWDPEPSATVTGDVTYTAVWTPAAPDWLGSNVTDNFVKFVCDTDPAHHDDVMVKWVVNYTKATSDPVWNEELGTWTADVRLSAIDTMYLWMYYEKAVGVDHDLVPDSPVPAGQDYLDITMKWDAASEQWVHLDDKPLEFHVSCRTMPTLPNSISGHQVKMVDATGTLANWFVNVKEGSYEYGEIKGSREEGFTLDVTLYFTGTDVYAQSWAANRSPDYSYDRTQTPEAVTVTLTYAGSLTGTLSSGPWQFNGMTNKGTIATVYMTRDYTLTLDANGGAVDPEQITVTYGSPVGELPVPTRTGYTFSGWTDENGEAVTAETVYTVAGDSTLTAAWTAKEYTISVDSGNGEEPAEIVATYDQPVEVPVPTREGYTFGGWTDENGNPVDPAEPYDGSYTELYAVWTANEYSITLNANGGAVDPEQVTVTYGSPVGELPVPTRTGYTFGGWTDENGEAVTAETVYAVAGDSTLTAVWTISPYVLTLDANGGAVEPDKISVFYGAAVGELPVPTREGYTFDGWYDANGTLVKADSLYTTAGNSTLTAKWTGKQYTLTLDPGNGEKSTEITVTYGSPVGKLPTPTRDGYKFVGWYDKDGNAVTADTVYNTAGNLTLKAKWVSNSANPATGDNSPLYLTSALFVLSAAALAVLFAEYKRRVKR